MWPNLILSKTDIQILNQYFPLLPTPLLPDWTGIWAVCDSSWTWWERLALLQRIPPLHADRLGRDEWTRPPMSALRRVTGLDADLRDGSRRGRPLHPQGEAACEEHDDESCQLKGSTQVLQTSCYDWSVALGAQGRCWHCSWASTETFINSSICPKPFGLRNARHTFLNKDIQSKLSESNRL